jgi:ribosomal protein L29
MSAEKGIKQLEDELAALIGEREGEQADEEQSEQIKEPAKSQDDDTFISKKTKDVEDENLSPEEATWKKRHGDLRRHQQKTERELKEQLEQTKAKLEELRSKPAGDPPTNPDEVKAWVEKFPQVAAIIKALAEEQANRLYGQEIQTIKKDSMSAKREKELARIYKAHDDFDEIKEDDAFHDWVDNQPDFIQDAVFQGNADKVIWALNTYKDSKKPKANPDKKAAEAIGKSSKTEITTSDGKKRFLESDIEDMTSDEYSKQAEEIQIAIREGRFVYDISGAAR